MITIGRTSLNHHPYEIDPTRHINVIGGSGVGKSSLLEHIFIEFIKQGHGGLFIDPHGDTADRLPLLIPKSRRRDIIWLDPDSDFLIPLNPLYFTDPEQLELAKETCLTILKALAGSDSAWGNATPYNIRNDLDAVKITGSKLKDIIVKRGTERKIGSYEAREKKEAEERVEQQRKRLEGEKAYQSFLKKYGYTSETAEDFVIARAESEVKLYKVVGVFKIK